jgi:predicted nucleic acid-binding protein
MVIADTGFFVALPNLRDRYHAAAQTALAGLTEPLVTTWPVMAETCHLLLRRLGAAAQERFIASFCDGAFEVFALEAQHGTRLRALMETYRDLPMDLADASLVILAESLGEGRILSTDERDFHAYRWKRTRPFSNLLLAPLD